MTDGYHKQSIQSQIADAFDRYYYEFDTVSSQFAERRESQTQKVEPIRLDAAQGILRPLYGKGAPNPPSIGDHPDYAHLKDTQNVANGSITTLFIDIQGSTRIGLLHTPEITYVVKNALIRVAIDVITAFDGHIHRIMGDAVMAFFGRTGERSELGAINAINCASVLRMLIQEAVVPKMKERGLQSKFGVRIGVDYGEESDVIWASYGLPRISEVTATSFYVDAAAKLQQAAGRNEIMIGEGLRGLLDFPSDLLDTKKRIKNGEIIEEPVLRPNYSLADGRTIDYRQHLLKWRKYLSCGPLAMVAGFDNNAPLKVSIELYSALRKTALGSFVPTGSYAPKEHALRFKFRFAEHPGYPYTIKTSVENHGEEARDAKCLQGQQAEYKISDYSQELTLEHWETTAYRGLHYLNVEVFKGDRSIMTGGVGIFIE